MKKNQTIDFRQEELLSREALKNIMGGQEEEPTAPNCKPSSTDCGLIVIGQPNTVVDGKCGVIKGTGMELDQCGCTKTNYTSSPTNDCVQS